MKKLSFIQMPIAIKLAVTSIMMLIVFKLGYLLGVLLK